MTQPSVLALQVRSTSRLVMCLTEGQRAAKLADQNFEVRFGPSIADAMKLPILMRKVVT